MKVSVIDNGGQWTHREWRVLRDIGVDATIIPNTIPLDEIDADGLVLSGGAPRAGLDADKMGNNGEYLDRAEIPILGICAGHQFMAIYFGGKAGPSGIPEFGKATVLIDEENDLFVDLPKSFEVWVSHNDEVSEVPQDFIVLAHSDNCAVQSMKHIKRPLYGLQFHPEVEHTEYGYDIFKNFVRLCGEL